MIPASFDESNCVLECPDPDVLPLSAFYGETADGTKMTICCWKITAEELAEVNRTGRVWLIIRGIKTCPVALAGISPFEVDR